MRGKRVQRGPRSATTRRIMSTIAAGGVSCSRMSLTPSAFSFGRSSSGITPPPTTRMSSASALLQQAHQAREHRHVRAGQDADADDVDVLLDRGLDDFFRRPVQSGVDDVHAGIAQRARDDLDAAIVAVEADLGDDDANGLRRFGHCSSSADGDASVTSRSEFGIRYSITTALSTESAPATRRIQSPRNTPPPMRRSALPWIILATVAVSAALAWFTLTRGGGASGRAPAVEHQLLEPFHELEIGGAADVILVQGDLRKRSTSTPPGVRPSRRTSPKAASPSGRATAADGGTGCSATATSNAPTITIHLRNLDRLLLTGTVKVAAPRLQAQSLRIGASGGANLTIDDLTATRLTVERFRRAQRRARRARRRAARLDFGRGIVQRRATDRGRYDGLGQRRRQRDRQCAADAEGKHLGCRRHRVRRRSAGDRARERHGPRQAARFVDARHARRERLLKARRRRRFRFLEQQRSARQRIDVRVDARAQPDVADAAIAQQSGEHRERRRAPTRTRRADTGSLPLPAARTPTTATAATRRPSVRRRRDGR